MINKGKIRESKYHYTILFALVNLFTIYLYTADTKLMSKSLLKFYNKMYEGLFNVYEIKYRDIVRLRNSL